MTERPIERLERQHRDIFPCPKPEPKAKPARTPRKRTRVKAKNARRGGHMFPKNVDEPYREWIRGLRCLLYGMFTPRDWHYGDARPIGWHKCVGPVQVCHVKTRGAGGPDRKNCVPMCASAHDQQHVIGIRAFEQRWGVSLKTIARLLTEMYEAEKFPCP